MTPRTANAVPEALAVLQASTETLIAELKRRGYKVYPGKRVRKYEIHGMILLEKLAAMSEEIRNGFQQMQWHKQAAELGRGLQTKKALLNLTVDDPEGSPVGPTRRFTSAIMIVLPKSFDFEAEAKEERDAEMARLKAAAEARKRPVD